MKSIPNNYRKNVAAVVVNDKRQILACRRIDLENVWQIPQGGVDDGEELERAVLRELAEEIGTNQVKIVGSLAAPICYEWPEHLYDRGHRGQEQYYFLVALNPPATINLAAEGELSEFDAAEWLSVEQFLLRVSGFKKDAYTLALRQLQQNYPELL